MVVIMSHPAGSVNFFLKCRAGWLMPKSLFDESDNPFAFDIPETGGKKSYAESTEDR
jgi:hypothetical protein